MWKRVLAPDCVLDGQAHHARSETQRLGRVHSVALNGAQNVVSQQKYALCRLMISRSALRRRTNNLLCHLIHKHADNRELEHFAMESREGRVMRRRQRQTKETQLLNEQ